MKIPPLDAKYYYNCRPIEVIDGDTFRAELSRDIDIGFDVKIRTSLIQLIRIYGVDSKEKYSKIEADKKLAIEAKNYLQQMLFTTYPFFSSKLPIIYTFKDKYAGRYDGLIYNFTSVGDLSQESLSESLLRLYPNHYIEYYGGKKE